MMQAGIAIRPGSELSIQINIGLGHVKAQAGDSAAKLTDRRFRANDKPSALTADDMPKTDNRTTGEKLWEANSFLQRCLIWA
jgi:hypothetical protein